MDALDAVLRESLVVIATLCFPVLALATAVGACVAVLQAATQIQEQTLTLLPKLCAVAALLATCGGAGMRLCDALFRHAAAAAPAIVRGP